MAVEFQQLILGLSAYWAEEGVVVLPPYEAAMGAGRLNPAKALNCLGTGPLKAAWVQGCRRPVDGRYADNPFRLQHHFEFQVLLKPAPDDSEERFLRSLAAQGLDLASHDVRLVATERDVPLLDAFLAGSEVTIDGMEVATVLYLQRFGGLDLDPVSLEFCIGLERLAMCLNGVDSVFDLTWGGQVSYEEMYRRREIEFSRYCFEEAEPGLLVRQFGDAEREALKLLDARLVIPAYDLLLRCAGLFDLIEARGTVGGSQLSEYSVRVRNLARACARGWIESQALEEMKVHGNS